MPFLYIMQNILCIAAFWSNAPWLIICHGSRTWRALGILMLFAGSALYRWALQRLREHYSPCYDTHRPNRLVTRGPYRWTQHPMYLSKLVIDLATLVISASLWFVPAWLYLYYATTGAMRRADAGLHGQPQAPKPSSKNALSRGLFSGRRVAAKTHLSCR